MGAKECVREKEEGVHAPGLPRTLAMYTHSSLSLGILPVCNQRSLKGLKLSMIPVSESAVLAQRRVEGCVSPGTFLPRAGPSAGSTKPRHFLGSRGIFQNPRVALSPRRWTEAGRRRFPCLKGETTVSLPPHECCACSFAIQGKLYFILGLLGAKRRVRGRMQAVKGAGASA